MKTILTIILLAITTLVMHGEDFINGSYYIKSASPDITHNWVGQSFTETGKLVVGKSYSSETDMFELITKRSQQVDIQFSSGLLARVTPNSEFRVDAFNQMVSDDSAQPEKLIGGDFVLNTALMNGEAYFVATKYTSPNTMCVLQTPLMNVELNGGEYHVKANQKYTIIYVLKGSLGVFDNQTNKKTMKSEGTMVLIFPSPMKSTDIMITEKGIEPEEYKKLTDDVQVIRSAQPQIMFALVNGKIVGIKL